MNYATVSCRILGGLCLLIATGLLVAGETFLRGRLGPLATLIYWSSALLAISAAIVCALVDMLRALGESRRERRALVENTLREITAAQRDHLKTNTANALKSQVGVIE